MQIAMLELSCMHLPPFWQMVDVQNEGVVVGTVVPAVVVVTDAALVAAAVVPAVVETAANEVSQNVPVNPGAHLHVLCQVQVPPFWHGEF